MSALSAHIRIKRINNCNNVATYYKKLSLPIILVKNPEL